MGKHKTAISLTLDRDLCDWFSGGGKNRSQLINHVLRMYLRKRLNDENESEFEETLLEDKTINNHLGAAYAMITNIEGFESLGASLLRTLIEFYRGD